MRIAIIGEYDPEFDLHLKTANAIAHSSAKLNLSVKLDWLTTQDLMPACLRDYSGIFIAPGSPYKDLIAAIAAIRFAREHKIPTLGTCGGFQHMVIEYARNVVGIRDAQHAEYDPYASSLIVSKLKCSLVGQKLSIHFAPQSLAARAYDSSHTTENYYCNFGVNSDYIGLLSNAGFQVTGTDSDGECRVMEDSSHPFFIGTLFVPQARSTADMPHPLITAFVLAASQFTR